MFAFTTDVKKGFRKARKDFQALKDSFNQWTIFFNGNQRELKMKVQELEKRLEKLEARNERKVLY